MRDEQEIPAPAVPADDPARLAWEGEERRQFRRRRLRRILLVLAPLVVAVAAGYAYLTGGRFVGTENAYVTADTVVVAPEISGRISRVAVEENERVEAGAPLFEIDKAPFRTALAEADARLAAARADYASVAASYRQKLEERALARENLSYAKRDLDRAKALLDRRALSESRYDTARHVYEVARLELDVVGQEIAEIVARLGGDPEAGQDAYPAVREALAARERAERDLARTVVRAPFAGVASQTPEPGAFVSAGVSVMSVVSDSDLWIEANFKETDLTRVEPGQSVEIRVDTYPDVVWRGTVESISPATGAEFSIIPPQNATGNWVKVVQRIPVRVAVAEAEGQPILRAGMSTEVEIDTGYERPLAGLLRTALGRLGDAVSPASAQADRMR